jgi:hypothetical protein
MSFRFRSGCFFVHAGSIRTLAIHLPRRSPCLAITAVTFGGFTRVLLFHVRLRPNEASNEQLTTTTRLDKTRRWPGPNAAPVLQMKYFSASCSSSQTGLMKGACVSSPAAGRSPEEAGSTLTLEGLFCVFS